jgi:hypothetical protein
VLELQTKEQKGREENIEDLDEQRICNLELKMNIVVELMKDVVLLLKCIACICVCGLIWSVCVGMRR